jgi:Leucine-rich repeat (LRR) protein
MLVGSYLNPHDVLVCTTQLCSSGAGFVATGITNKRTTILLHELVECCRLSAGVDDIAQECVARIESFVARRGNVQTIILRAQLRRKRATNASVYSNIHDHLQQGSWLQLGQNQEVTVEWYVSAESIAQVEFLLKVDVPKDGARVSDSPAGGALRQSLHTLNLCETQVSDVFVLASFTSLHKLDLSETGVSDVSPLASCTALHTLDLVGVPLYDVSPLASCQSLHKLDLSETGVSDLSPLASCQSLHTLNLTNTPVIDVSSLRFCQSLHTLNLRYTQVSDVSALALCQNLHTLILSDTLVRNVSALASCKSLHTLYLVITNVRDVSALASCQSLRKLVGVEDMIGGFDVMRIIQNRR